MNTNIKKKHHFVSQFYLRAWLSEENRIFAWNGVDNSHSQRTESIAYEKSLYKVVALKPKQMNFLESHAKKLNFYNLSTYKMVVCETQKTLQMSKIAISIAKSNPNHENSAGQLEEIHKIFSNNIIEEKFSLEEEKFSVLLEKIKNRPLAKIIF